MKKYYQEMKEKHQEMINNFPMFFAFSEKQFEEGMKKLGLEPNEKEKVLQTGASGFIKKEDKEKYLNMFKQMEQDHEEIMKNEEKSEEYMRDMCSYELWNHEYGYTYELEDAVRTMGYTMESIQKEEKLYKILLEEAKKIRESEEV